MTERRAIVVGAGIGGLAAAIGLHRVGWAVRVLEKTPVLAEVGAGIALWSNALRALESLGVAAEIRAHGTLQGEAHAEQPSDGRLVLAGDLTGLVEIALEQHRLDPGPGLAVAGAHARERDVALDGDRGAEGRDHQDRVHEGSALGEEVDDRIEDVHGISLLM